MTNQQSSFRLLTNKEFSLSALCVMCNLSLLLRDHLFNVFMLTRANQLAFCLKHDNAITSKLQTMLLNRTNSRLADTYTVTERTKTSMKIKTPISYKVQTMFPNLMIIRLCPETLSELQSLCMISTFILRLFYTFEILI